MAITTHELEHETCDDGLRCLYGSTCAPNLEEEGTFHCDCSSITDKSFVGRYCEYGPTDDCQTKPEHSDYSFCTNGGTCKSFKDTTDRIEHEGCDCSSLYDGSRCEYVAGTFGYAATASSGGGGGGGLSNTSTALIVVFCMFAFILAAAYYVYRTNKRKLEMEESLAMYNDGHGSMPTVDSIRNSFDGDGNMYPVNHSALLRSLAKTGSTDSQSPTKRRTSSPKNGPNVIQFEEGINARPYRDVDYDKPVNLGGKNTVSFESHMDEDDDEGRFS